MRSLSVSLTATVLLKFATTRAVIVTNLQDQDGSKNAKFQYCHTLLLDIDKEQNAILTLSVVAACNYLAAKV